MSLFLFFVLPASIFGQDPHFTQYYSNPLQLNPSFAGSAGISRFVATYRNQWPGLKAYKTIVFSYDQHCTLLKGGIGIIFLRDYSGEASLGLKKINYGKGRSMYTIGEGIFTTTRLGFIYSSTIIFRNKISIKPSFETEFFQKRFDWSKLTFGDMIDPRYGFIYNTREVPGPNAKSGVDFSSGILVNCKKWNGGIAIHHLTQPDEGLLGSSKLPIKYTFHGSYIFSKSDSSNFAFSPSLLIMNQGSFSTYVISANFKQRKFQWGIGYRARDAAILMLGFRGKYFRLGYSYDVTLSKLSFVTGGSHELNLGVMLNYKHIPEKFVAMRGVVF